MTVAGVKMVSESTVTFDDVRRAAKRLNGRAHRTPVLSSRTLNERLGATVFFKCENFQKMGAFKFRGAYNAMAQLTVQERAAGVITFSSGNHAQAVALVGRMLGIGTTVVMPENAPATKMAATEGYGATVVTYDPAEADRRELAEQLSRKSGAVIIPPFDHAHVIAGQGTAAMELFQDVGPLDFLLVPCGGGGLLSGSALSAQGLCSSCRVKGVEPALADDAARSFKTRRLQRVKNPPTIADGTRTASLGRITFALILQYVAGIETVSEAAIMEAVRFFFFRMKLVVEPSGALGLAALLNGAGAAGGRIGVIVSGGNIDAATMRRVLIDGENRTGEKAIGKE